MKGEEMDEERRTNTILAPVTVCPRCLHLDHDHFDCPARVIDLTHAPVDSVCHCSGDRREQ